MIVPLRTKPFGLYRHRRGLGFTQSRLQRRKSNIRIAKLVFHAKESPIRTWDEVSNLVSSRSNSPAKVYSSAVRIPPNPGLPHRAPRRKALAGPQGHMQAAARPLAARICTIGGPQVDTRMAAGRARCLPKSSSAHRCPSSSATTAQGWSCAACLQRRSIPGGCSSSA